MTSKSWRFFIIYLHICTLRLRASSKNIYTYVYICMYIHVYTYVYICIYMNVSAVHLKSISDPINRNTMNTEFVPRFVETVLGVCRALLGVSRALLGPNK